MPLPPIEEVLGTAPKPRAISLPPIEQVLGGQAVSGGLPPIEEVLAPPPIEKAIEPVTAPLPKFLTEGPQFEEAKTRARGTRLKEQLGQAYQKEKIAGTEAAIRQKSAELKAKLTIPGRRAEKFATETLGIPEFITKGAAPVPALEEERREIMERPQAKAGFVFSRPETKVARELKKEYPDEQLGRLTDDQVMRMMDWPRQIGGKLRMSKSESRQYLGDEGAFIRDKVQAARQDPKKLRTLLNSKQILLADDPAGGVEVRRGEQIYKGDPFGHVKVPAARVIPATEQVLGAPFRLTGGAVQAAQDELRKALTPEAFKPISSEEAHIGVQQGPFETIWKSLTSEEPRYLGDVFAKGLSVSLGRPLDVDEAVYSHLFGLFADIMGPGQGLKIFRLGRGKPEAPTVGKQVGKAVKRAGVKTVEPRKTFFAGKVTGKGVEKADDIAEKLGKAVTRPELERIGQRVAAAPTLPERIGIVRAELRALGRNLGLTDKVIEGTERQLIKTIGQEGQFLGKSGVRPTRLPMREKTAAQILETEGERILPLGAQATPLQRGLRKAGAPEFFYGAGTAGKVAEELRPAQAIASVGAEQAIKEAKDIRGLFGKEQQDIKRLFGIKTEKIPAEVEASIARDLKSDFGTYQKELDAFDHQLRSAYSTGTGNPAAIEDEIARVNAGWQRKLEIAGKTEAEARVGFVPRNPEQKQAIEFYQQSMDDMARVEKEFGILPEDAYRSEYVARIETQISKNKGTKLVGPAREKGAGMPSAKKRLGTKAAQTIADEKFIQELSESYYNRKMSHAIATSNAVAEKEILRNYARQAIPGVDVAAKEAGLARYVGKTGPHKGIEYYLDEGVAKMLERTVNPENLGKYMKQWTKMTNWWKARATIFRPGFMFRNVMFGNTWQLWQADVNVLRELGPTGSAWRVLARRAGKTPTGRDTVLRGFLNKMGGEGTGKIGKWTVDEVLKMAEDAKVFGGGFFGAELSGQGADSMLRGAKRALEAGNPMGKNFVAMEIVAKLNRTGEDAARLALFIDRLRKGFTPREAVSQIAKYVFNYDELARFGKVAKNIIPFYTWNAKNWGMQIADLLNKPDKIANFYRGLTGIQDLDPMSREEMHDAEAQPDWMKEQQAIRLPGMRGDEGERMYAMGAGLFPMVSLKQLEPSKIMPTIGQMLHPIFRVVQKGFTEPADRESPFWGTPPTKTDAYVWAPGWAKDIMDAAEGVIPDSAYEKMEILFQPVIGQRTGLKMGYKWHRDVNEWIQAIDPGLATINQVWVQNKDEQSYNKLIATIFGIKPFGATIGRKLYWQVKSKTQALKDLQTLETKRKQLGGLDPKIPFRNF